MTYLIYNPLANNMTGEVLKDEALEYLKDKFSDLEVVNGYDLDISKFVESVLPTDNIILVGGDGTLNIFANYVYNKGFKNNFYIFRSGTGNDFCNDVAQDNNEKLIRLNEYLEKLPKLTVNGKERYYLNCAGLGIDGLICEKMNAIKSKGKKKANYTWVSFKCLMKQYKKSSARVIVDGVESSYKHVWIATTMHGRYFGGGMPLTPEQNRNDHDLSFVLFSCKSRIKTIFIFLQIFKAKHVKFTKNVHITKAKKVEVYFSNPCVLQIDGETISDVTSYTVEI